MQRSFITFLLLAVLLALISQSVLASAPPAKAIVVLRRNIGQMHAGINTYGAYSVALGASFNQVSNNFGTQSSSGSFGGDMAGGLVGGMIAGAIIASKQQKAMDAAIAPLTSLASEKEREASIRSGIAAALAKHGIADIEYIFSDAPDAKLLPRIVTDDNTAFVLFLDSDSSEGFASSLVTLSANNQTLRIAARLAWVKREGRRFSKVITRRINLLSNITRAQEAAEALSERVTAGGQVLLQQIELASTQLVDVALQDQTDVVADKDETVAFVNAVGAFKVAGKLLKRDDREILVVDRRGNLAIFNADMVLTN